MLRALLFFVPLFLVLACATPPPVPPAMLDGEWAYTAIDVTSGKTWDKGNIRFHGGTDQGNWDLENSDGAGEVGTWNRTEIGIDLSGDNHWVLRSEKGSTITGTWDAGSSGHGTLTLQKN
jgi:hypothetical protein